MPFWGKAWVLDSSALINFKHIIGIEHQWQFLECLKEMVTSGELYICRAVVKEVKQPHPDAPGAWAYGVRDLVQEAYDPQEVFVAEVMVLAGDVIDDEDEESDADPHVVAQALELRSRGFDVCVVTTDARSHQDRIAMTEACARFEIKSCSDRDFIAEIECGAGELRERR
jgi:hypothetical protein